ncbi:hypothetical protein NHE_0029 [Neorickettsia helminthoeca str. Oregon]|uniref:Uncharacterized protein n=1 Tax=Neorickettsia helminthoeca str. Oregon TaxID=1286528 RepID=X5HIZ0_9RICK|nr:hypothetical protein NHE_0029 [Neorickettsia helminthoeca str. Oregon]
MDGESKLYQEQDQIRKKVYSRTFDLSGGSLEVHSNVHPR